MPGGSTSRSFASSVPHRGGKRCRKQGCIRRDGHLDSGPTGVSWHGVPSPRPATRTHSHESLDLSLCGSLRVTIKHVGPVQWFGAVWMGNLMLQMDNVACPHHNIFTCLGIGCLAGLSPSMDVDVWQQ